MKGRKMISNSPSVNNEAPVSCSCSIFLLRLKSLDVSWWWHGGHPSKWGGLWEPSKASNANVGDGWHGSWCWHGWDGSTFCGRPRHVPAQLSHVLSSPRPAALVNCSLSGHLTHNCDGVWILMWFLYQRHYFCTFATLSPWYESLTECGSLLRGESLRLKMARGQQKIQSQQKAAEKAAKLKKAVRKRLDNGK